MNRSTQILLNLTTALLVVVVLVGASSCRKDKMDKIAAVTDRKAIPGLHANEITTVISDSGITRYRIYTKQWDIFDKATEPYWNFPKGIHFEKFNENLVIDANFHCNKARYYQNRKLWEFSGKVKAINLKGEMFETEKLFWNQNEQIIYSDSLVKVTQKTKILTGIGFESNQDMTRYHIKQLKGILAVEGEEKSMNSPVPVPASTPAAPPVKP